MKRTLAILVLMAAACMYSTSAGAVTKVFSFDQVDYGAKLEFDASNKVLTTFEFRLPKTITYASLPLFSANANYVANSTAFADWNTTKNEKLSLIVMSVLPYPWTINNLKEVPVTCSVTGEATDTKGEKITCVQKTAVTIGALTQAEFESLAHYVYIFPLDAYTLASGYQRVGAPVNLAAVAARGLEAVVEQEEEEEEEACDVADTTLDCDNDGVLNGADACVSEAGTGTDGCPVADTGAGAGDTATTIGDGGGCSTIAPVSTPNVSGILLMAAAMLPMLFRRRNR